MFPSFGMHRARVLTIFVHGHYRPVEFHHSLESLSSQLIDIVPFADKEAAAT